PPRGRHRDVVAPPRRSGRRHAVRRAAYPRRPRDLAGDVSLRPAGSNAPERASTHTGSLVAPAGSPTPVSEPGSRYSHSGVAISPRVCGLARNQQPTTVTEISPSPDTP